MEFVCDRKARQLYVGEGGGVDGDVVFIGNVGLRIGEEEMFCVQEHGLFLILKNNPWTWTRGAYKRRKLRVWTLTNQKRGCHMGVRRSARLSARAAHYARTGQAILSAGGAAVNLARNAYQAYARSSSRTQNSRKQGGAARITTQQFDVKRVYRRKRMPRRKRRRWVRFKRKVDAVQFSGLGMQSVVFNSADYITAAVGAQGVGSVCLYGLRGVSGTGGGVLMGQNDLYMIKSNAGYTNTQKIAFRSAVLDITCKNEPIDSEDSGTQLEVDLYEYVWRKGRPMESQSTAYGSGLSALQTGFTDQPTLGSAAALAVTTRGVTPFQCPEGMSYLKILKKTKFFVPVAGTFTYQLRQPRNFWFDMGDPSSGLDIESCAGRTRGVLIFVKGVPTLATPASGARLVVGCTRTYEYKIEGETVSRDGFIVAV